LDRTKQSKQDRNKNDFDRDPKKKETNSV